MLLFKVPGDVLYDGAQCADLEGLVLGYGDMMFLVPKNVREPDVAACLAGLLVTKGGELTDELVSAEVPGELHTGMSSSLTIWRRMTLGLSGPSKWQPTASLTISLISSMVSACVNMECPRAFASRPPSGDSSTTNIISFSTSSPRMVS